MERKRVSTVSSHRHNYSQVNSYFRRNVFVFAHCSRLVLFTKHRFRAISKYDSFAEVFLSYLHFYEITLFQLETSLTFAMYRPVSQK
jgi:hypothetical protein